MRAVLDQRIEALLARQKAPREKAPEKAQGEGTDTAAAAPAVEQKNLSAHEMMILRMMMINQDDDDQY